jgi:glutamate synthase domain-containing protein 3
MSTFNQLVESVKKLSLDEKEELQLLLEKYLIEARRDEIYTHFEESKTEYKKQKPKFSSDLNKLKKML